MGENRERLRRFSKVRAGELHAPVGEVAHGRFTDQVGEPRRERRARHADLFGQRRHCPFSCGLAMDRSKRSSHLLVAQGGEPSPIGLWCRIDPRADHLNDENVGQPSDDGFSARSQLLRFTRDKTKRALQPAALIVVPGVDLQHRR